MHIKNAEVNVPFGYLSSFWRSLDLPLINCKIELDLSWSNYCVMSEISRTPALRANPPVLTNTSNKNNWSNISNKQLETLCFTCYFVY